MGAWNVLLILKNLKILRFFHFAESPKSLLSLSLVPSQVTLVESELGLSQVTLILPLSLCLSWTHFKIFHFLIKIMSIYIMLSFSNSDLILFYYPFILTQNRWIHSFKLIKSFVISSNRPVYSYKCSLYRDLSFKY